MRDEKKPTPGTLKRRRTGLGRIVLALALCLMPQACDDPDESNRPLTIEYHPLELIDSPLRCSPKSRAETSPADYVTADLAFRTRDGVVVWPMDVRCVVQNFTPEELSARSAKGDAVAGYAVLAARYKDGTALCRDISSVEAALRGLSLKPQSDKIYTQYLPEAHLLIGRTREFCKVSGWEIFIQESADYGFDPSLLLSNP